MKAILVVFFLLLLNVSLFPQKMFYSTGDDYSIKSANFDGSNGSTLYISATGTPKGVTVDVLNKKVYFSDNHFSVAKIMRSNYDGSNREDIISSVSAISITVDPNGGKIFYTTNDDYSLKSANLDGSGIATLYTSATGTPEGVTVDIINSKIYFTDNHATVSKIMKCNYDGSELVSLVNSVKALNIAVDPLIGKMFFTTNDDYSLKSANLDGSGINVLYISATGTPNGISVDITNNKVYFTDNHGTVLKIMRCNYDGTNRSDIITSTKAISIVNENFEGALPVELTSFNYTFKNNSINLNWETAAEVNNYGFEIERNINNFEWGKIGFIEGHGNSNSPKFYNYSDSDLENGVYQYRLKQIDNDGTFKFSNIIEVNVNIPTEFLLTQNYPNPFNPSTTITFSIPSKDFVKVSVFNSLGEEVKTLMNEEKEAGNYNLEINMNGFSSGVYYYKLSTTNNSQVRKMVLMK